MRFVLILLAVMGLLASPAAAAAAQVTCHERGSAEMMSMPMMGMAAMAHSEGQKSDPCCDPAKDQRHGQHDAMSCVQACALMCGVVAALPSTPIALVAPAQHATPEPGRLASLKPHEPSRLERPPRSIA